MSVISRGGTEKKGWRRNALDEERGFSILEVDVAKPATLGLDCSARWEEVEAETSLV